jgi:hypothetical protein
MRRRERERESGALHRRRGACTAGNGLVAVTKWRRRERESGESARCAQVRKGGEADLGFNFIGLRGRENDGRVERP